MKKTCSAIFKVLALVLTFLAGLIVGGCVVANDYYTDKEDDYEYEDEVLSI